MNRQFLTGFTHTLQFDFFDEIGFPTGVNSPTTKIFTPGKRVFEEAGVLTAVAGTCNSFTFNFFAPVGLTVGQWFSIGTGLTNANNAMILSDQYPFEIVDLTVEPFWVSLSEFRDYINVPSTDHTRDRFYKQLLQSSMELVEAHTARKFGTQVVNETVEIQGTARVKLKCFPIQQIVGLTVSAQLIPRSITSLVNEQFTGSQVSFFFRLDETNGIMVLTDDNGFEISRDGLLMNITYEAGFASVPEPVRQAALALASQFNNLSCQEGFDTVRLTDMSFTASRSLFKGVIGDMLKPYRNVGIWSSSLNTVD